MGIFVDAISERRSEADLLRNPSAFFAAIFGDYQPNDAGIPVNATTAMRYSPVIACVRILAESIAQVPWNVMRARKDRGADVATDTVEHRLLHRAPNPLMSSYTFRVALVANAVLHGAGFAQLVWNGAGKLDEIRLIPADRVTIRQSKKTGDLYYDITRLDGTIESVHMSDMVHVPTLALDGITGMSLIQAHNQGIAVGLAAEKFGASFFGKGSRPSGVLTSDVAVTEEQRKIIAETWQAAFGGSENAGKTPVLSGGLKWQQLTIPPDDAQFLQTREFQVAECARIFRIPGVMLGIKETSTYASAEQFFLSFVKYTLGPWAEAIEQEFDRKLFPKNMEMYTHLDMRGLMRGDAASRASYYKSLFDMGSITPNEIRNEEDWNPLEDGDRAYVQQALMPVDMVDEVLKSKSQKPEQPATESDVADVHMRWLEYVVGRMRSWKNYDKVKGAAALVPVFKSLDPKVDVDAFCRGIAEEQPGDGFAARAMSRFEEMRNAKA